MLRFARWKVALILGMIALAFLIILPSLLPADTRTALAKALPSWVPMQSIVLGLDLQGGAHLLLQVDSSDVTNTQLNNLRDDVRQTLREQNIKITGGIGAQGRTVQVRIPAPADRDKALTALRPLGSPLGASILGTAAPSPYNVSMNADGLVQMTLTDGGLNDVIRRAVDQTIEVLRRRI